MRPPSQTPINNLLITMSERVSKQVGGVKCVKPTAWRVQERERQRGGDAKLNKERAREQRRLRKLMAQANKARAEREKLASQPPLPPDHSQPAQPPQPPLPPRPVFSGFSLGAKKTGAKPSVKASFSSFSFTKKKKMRTKMGFSFLFLLYYFI